MAVYANYDPDSNNYKALIQCEVRIAFSDVYFTLEDIRICALKRPPYCKKKMYNRAHAKLYPV